MSGIPAQGSGHQRFQYVWHGEWEKSLDLTDFIYALHEYGKKNIFLSKRRVSKVTKYMKGGKVAHCMETCHAVMQEKIKGLSIEMIWL